MHAMSIMVMNSVSINLWSNCVVMSGDGREMYSVQCVPSKLAKLLAFTTISASADRVEEDARMLQE